MGGAEDEIEADVGTTVVDSTNVVTIDRVTNTVDTVIVAGRVVVRSDVGPGRRIVLEIVEAGNVMSDRTVLVEVLPGN